MTERNQQLIIGAVAAAAVAVIGFLALQDPPILTPELAAAASAIVAFIAGFLKPKAPAA